MAQSRGMQFTGGPFGTTIVDQAALVHAIGGKVFYVNSASGGADDTDHPWPEIDNEVCFSTLQGAIDKCVHNRGDIIHVKRGYTAITTPVLFNKSGISVLAQSYGHAPIFGGEYFSIDNTGTTEAAAIVSRPCRIVGLGFNTAWTGGISSALTCEWESGFPGWLHLKHCRFMNWGGSLVYGINFEAGANCVVEECSFEGTSGAFTAGIAFGGSATNNPTRNIVRNCLFQDCTYAIEHKDGTPQNMVYGPGNVTVDSKFLNTKGAACDGIVYGNYFDTAVGNATFDDTVANVETLGMSIVGNEYKTEDPGPT